MCFCRDSCVLGTENRHIMVSRRDEVLECKSDYACVNSWTELSVMTELAYARSMMPNLSMLARVGSKEPRSLICRFLDSWNQHQTLTDCLCCHIY